MARWTNMTMLSVNVNKIALLRNARGQDYPNVIEFVKTCIELGVKGITVHPRPDERHVTRKDVKEISTLLNTMPEVEFNIEGYPSDTFMELVLQASPDQCTLVPDKPGQLTSDHGWHVDANQELLEQVIGELRQAGIRSSLFVEPDEKAVEAVAQLKCDRIELYTESYAASYSTPSESSVYEQYREAANKATALGIGVNAGHDLNLVNLGHFLEIPEILEVSIGHALVVESIHQGLAKVIEKYLAITGERN